MSEIRFVKLTNDQASAAGLPTESLSYGVAVDDETGEVVSMASFNKAYRGLMCDNCDLACAQGGIVWTRRDRRSEGIFGKLWSWLKDQEGIKTVYSHDLSVTGQLVASKRGLKLPKSDTFMSEAVNLYETEVSLNAAAKALEAAM